MANNAANTFRDSLKQILTDYPTPDNIGEGTEFETAHSDHSIYQLVVDQAGSAIRELVDTGKYTTKASVGRGSPTFIPYIAVMNKNETTSPQTGRYIVYLFDPIERCLYLTLNQGATEAKKIASESDLTPTEILRARAERMAREVDLQDFTADHIEFSPRGEKGELYGAGTICYKEYSSEDFPTVESIRDDLDRILEIYDQIITTPVPEVVDNGGETSNRGDEDLSDYWNLVRKKQDSGEKFINSPTNENLTAFLEEFWTLRAAPSIDWILSNWLSEYSPEEVADKLREAIEQEDITIAVELNGFGVSVASECLRALEPSTFPILNGPAYEGMKTLGYDPIEPSDASPEDYLDFAADVADAIDRYDLLQIAEDADSITFPEWATVLQIVDHLFYQHTNEDHEFNFDEWLPCESTVETAPYYWVNQSVPSDDKTKLEVAPDGDFDTELGRLETNDTVFHHDDGEIIGYSTVNEDPTTVRVDNELRCQVDVSFTAFEESIPFSNVFEYLLHEKDEDDEYFPIDESGLKSGYLYNLSEPAGNYILQQVESDEPPESQIERLEKRLSQPEFSITLPTDLYFHEREASRLKQQINAALNSGKHIIFTGPPGTGKSKLAKDIAEQATDHHSEIDGHVFTTATAEWTTFDTIGGYVPDESGDSLEFDPRLFLRCFRDDEGVIQNKWLVVDELNRANIDKALGPLFSVLAQDSVQLPFERESRIQIDWIDEYPEDDNGILSEIAHNPDRFPVTPSWWLIGTMNTVDKTSLYDLSFAFMRRFSFVHVGVPELTIDVDGDEIVSRNLLDPTIEKQNYALTWQQQQPELRDTIEKYHEELSIIWAIVNDYRPIGPAIVLDILEHLHAHEGGDERTPLTSAIISLVLPQMEGLREQDQLDLLNDLEAGLPIQNQDGGKTEIKLRIDFDYLRRKAYDMFDLDPDE